MKGLQEESDASLWGRTVRQGADKFKSISIPNNHTWPSLVVRPAMQGVLWSILRYSSSEEYIHRMKKIYNHVEGSSMLLKVVYLSGSVGYGMFQNGLKLMEITTNPDRRFMIGTCELHTLADHVKKGNVGFEAVFAEGGVTITRSEGFCVNIESTQFEGIIDCPPLLMEYLEAATTSVFSEIEFLQEEAA